MLVPNATNNQCSNYPSPPFLPLTRFPTIVKNTSAALFVFALLCTMLSLASATKCFCLQNSGADTRLGLNRLACQRAGHDFHPDGCYVATTNGCGVPPQGPEINQMINACKSLGGDWSAGYLNCRC